MAAMNSTPIGLDTVAAGTGSYVHMVINQLANPWTLIFTLLSMAVIYDQTVYIWRRQGIVGPAFKIPFMGPFLQSIDPKFHEYVRQWASGPLSCVSVFHK
jgi:C-22 sterol desaturase